MFADNSIKECTFCGERCSGKFCKDHGTKDGRKKSIEEQLTLEKERGSATELLFGHNRDRLLKQYGI